MALIGWHSNRAPLGAAHVFAGQTPASIAKCQVTVNLARQAWRSALLPRPICEFAQGPQSSSKVYDLQKSAASRHANVTTADFSAAICPDGKCPLQQAKFVNYRDSNHLTASLVKSLEGALAAQVSVALRPTAP